MSDPISPLTDDTAAERNAVKVGPRVWLVIREYGDGSDDVESVHATAQGAEAALVCCKNSPSYRTWRVDEEEVLP